MSTISDKIKELPFSPGVYIFKNYAREILYVGKATSLKDRVGSYFTPSPQPSPDYSPGWSFGEAGGRGGNRPIEIKISEVADFEIKKTDTVIEAYILEQKLIKDLQPKYNVDGKDDRSFCYAVVTKEDFPRFIILRKTELDKILVIASKAKQSQIKTRLPRRYAPHNDIKIAKIYGPYTSRWQIETVFKILRKIFPYHSMKQKTEKGCLDYQLGKCPGPYAGAISKTDYRKNIRGIRMILEGKKKSLIHRMKKEMDALAEEHQYEKAAVTRNKIFALEHIQDMALISRNSEQRTMSNDKIRIEGYDISNISGKYSVGSMVVFDNSEGSIMSNRAQYRKFRIKTVEGANDVAAMREVLMRRFRNAWGKPNLIILDGGKGHLNMARSVLRIYHLDIPILAVAKGSERKKLDRYSFGTVPEYGENRIVEQVRDEAHRFAISYHKKLRQKSIRE